MTQTPRLADLRAAPIVGKFYLVPTVLAYPYHGIVGDWPVLGALHSDREHFKFLHNHYHVDARFLTRRQVARLAKYAGYEGVGALINRSPLFYRGQEHAKGRPPVQRRRCTVASFGFAYTDRREVRDMQAAYGPAPEPIRKADGRLLCPHRKVDLSQFPRDADGFVTCPMHGLRVRCAAPTSLTSGASA